MRKGTGGMGTQKETLGSIHVCLCVSPLLTCPHSYQSSLGKKGRGTEGPREKLGAESGVTSAGSVQEGGT